jgi:hypothetical protein
MSTRTKKLRSSKNKLSEIEGCVLGLLAVDGPATPYAIRKVFLESPNPQWSGNAGTIYPLAGVPPDPLRTRIRSLGAIGNKLRLQFLQDAFHRTQAHLAAIEADCARRRTLGEFEYLIARGALLSMQSRCAFLQEVSEALGTCHSR